MRPLIQLDVTRLTKRGLRAAPTGIDRVELAYLGHLLQSDSVDLEPAVAGDLLVRRMSAEQGARLHRAVTARWQEDGRESSGPRASLPTALRRLALPPLPPGTRGGREPIYLNVSHSNVANGPFRRWLARRSGPAVFMVHDLIPVTHPEYCRPGQAAIHARRMETIARRASLVLANSAATADDFAAFCTGAGLQTPPLSVTPLGIEPAFLEIDPAPGAPDQPPYFLVVGTIEPRKNHLLLLNLWRAMAARLGEATPRLVIAGRRGWENENVLDMLDRSPALKPHVVEAGTTSDRALLRLMKGATALLVPSFTEGFSLPVAEGVALGVSVIASDIPVHREVGGDAATYLDPLDGPAWLSAIEEALRKPAPRREHESPRSHSWEKHFTLVDALLARIGNPS